MPWVSQGTLQLNLSTGYRIIPSYGGSRRYLYFNNGSPNQFRRFSIAGITPTQDTSWMGNGNINYQIAIAGSTGFWINSSNNYRSFITTIRFGNFFRLSGLNVPSPLFNSFCITTNRIYVLNSLTSPTRISSTSYPAVGRARLVRQTAEDITTSGHSYARSRLVTDGTTIWLFGISSNGLTVTGTAWTISTRTRDTSKDFSATFTTAQHEVNFDGQDIYVLPANPNVANAVTKYSFLPAGYTPTLGNALDSSGNALTPDGSDASNRITSRSSFIAPITWPSGSATDVVAGFAASDVTVTSSNSSVASATVTSVTRVGSTDVWRALITISESSTGVTSSNRNINFSVSVSAGALPQSSTRGASLSASKIYYYQATFTPLSAGYTPTLGNALDGAGNTLTNDGSSTSLRITSRASFIVPITWPSGSSADVVAGFTRSDITVTSSATGIATAVVTSVTRVGSTDVWRALITITEASTGITSSNQNISFAIGVSAGALPQSSTRNASQAVSETYYYTAAISLLLGYTPALGNALDSDGNVLTNDGGSTTTRLQSPSSFIVPITWPSGSATDVVAGFTSNDVTVTSSAAGVATAVVTSVTRVGSTDGWRALITVTEAASGVTSSNRNISFEIGVSAGALPRSSTRNASQSVSRTYYYQATLSPLSAGYTPNLGNALDSAGNTLTNDGGSTTTRLQSPSSFIVPITWPSGSATDVVASFTSSDVTVTSSATGVATAVITSVTRVGSTDVWRALITITEASTGIISSNQNINFVISVSAGALPQSSTRNASQSVSRTYYYQAALTPLSAGYTPTLGNALDGRGDPLTNDGSSTSLRMTPRNGFFVPITWPSGSSSDIQAGGFDESDVTVSSSNSSVATAHVSSVGSVSTDVWRAWVVIEKASTGITTSNQNISFTISVSPGAIPQSSTRNASQSASKIYYYQEIRSNFSITVTPSRGTSIAALFDSTPGPSGSQPWILTAHIQGSGTELDIFDYTGSRLASWICNTSKRQALIVNSRTHVFFLDGLDYDSFSLVGASGTATSGSSGSFSAAPGDVTTTIKGAFSRDFNEYYLGVSRNSNLYIRKYNGLTASNGVNTGIRFADAAGIAPGPFGGFLALDKASTPKRVRVFDRNLQRVSTLDFDLHANDAGDAIAWTGSQPVTFTQSTNTVRFYPGVSDGYAPILGTALAGNGDALSSNADGSTSDKPIPLINTFIVPITWDAPSVASAASNFTKGDVTVQPQDFYASAVVTSLTRQGSTNVWHALITVTRSPIFLYHTTRGSWQFTISVVQNALPISSNQLGSAAVTKIYHYGIAAGRTTPVPTLGDALAADGSALINDGSTEPLRIRGTTTFVVMITWNEDIVDSAFTSSDISFYGHGRSGGGSIVTPEVTSLSKVPDTTKVWRALITLTDTPIGSDVTDENRTIHLGMQVDPHALPPTTYQLPSARGGKEYYYQASQGRLTPGYQPSFGTALAADGTPLSTSNDGSDDTKPITTRNSFIVPVTWPADAVVSTFSWHHFRVTSSDESVAAGDIRTVTRVGSTNVWRAVVNVYEDEDGIGITTSNQNVVLTVRIIEGVLPQTANRDRSKERSHNYYYQAQLTSDGWIPTLGTALDGSGNALSTSNNGSSASNPITSRSTFIVPITWPLGSVSTVVRQFTSNDITVTSSATGVTTAVVTSITRVGVTNVWRALITVTEAGNGITSSNRGVSLTVSVVAGAIPRSSTRDQSQAASQVFYYQAALSSAAAGWVPTLGTALDSNGNALSSSNNGSSASNPITSRSAFIVPITWTSGSATDVVANFTSSDMSVTSSSNVASAVVTSITRQGSTDVWRALITVTEAGSGITSSNRGISLTVSVATGAIPRSSTRNPSQAASQVFYYQAALSSLAPGWVPTLGTALDGIGNPLSSSNNGDSVSNPIPSSGTFIVPITWTFGSAADVVAEFTSTDITVASSATGVAAAVVTSVTRVGSTNIWHALMTVTEASMGITTSNQNISFTIDVIAGALPQSSSRNSSQSASKIYYYRAGLTTVLPVASWGGIESPLGTSVGATYYGLASIFYINVTWSSNVGSTFTRRDITITSSVQNVTYEVDRVTNVGSSGTSTDFRVRFTGNGPPGERFTDQVLFQIPDNAVTANSLSNTATSVRLPLNVRILDLDIPGSYVNWEVPAGIQDSAFEIRGVWSVAVSNFTMANINVSTGTVSEFTYSTTTRVFTFIVTPPNIGQGVINIAITGAGISPPLLHDQRVSVGYRQLIQAATFVTWTPPVGIQRQSFSISGTWSRAVTGFTESDVQLSAGTKSGFTYSASTRTFSLMVTPPASPPGTSPETVNDLTISIPTTAVTPEPASCQTETVPYAPPIPPFVYWRLPPGVQTSRFNLSGFWSKDVTGFARSHVTLSSGTMSNFNSCGRRFSFTITPPSQGSGTIVISIAANSVTPANNLLTENIGYRSSVTPFVTWDVPTGIQQGAFNVRGTWSEPVTGFASTAIQLSAGTLTNFSYCPGSREFTFVLTPPSDSSGILRITIDATVVTPNASAPQTVEVPYTQPSPLTKVGLEGANVLITPLTERISESVATPAFLVEFDEDVELPSGSGLETDFTEWLELAGIQIPDAAITVRETDTRTIIAQNPPCTTRRFAYGVDYTLRIEVRPPLATTPSSSGFTVTGATLTSITSVGSGRLYDLLLEFPSSGTGSTQVKANASYFTGVDADITLMECLYGESNLRVINFPTGVIPEESEVSFQIACEPPLTATPQPSAIQLSSGTVTGLCEAGVGTVYNVQLRMPSGTGTVTVTALAAGFTNITMNQVLGTIQYRDV